MTEKDIKKQIPKAIEKIKLKVLVNSFKALEIIGRKEGVPVMVQWKLIPMIKLVRTKREDFGKLNNKLVKELGEKIKSKDELGNDTEIYKVKPENMDKYEEDIEKLLDEDVEVEVPSLKYSELKAGNDKFTLSTNVLADVDWLIKQ